MTLNGQPFVTPPVAFHGKQISVDFSCSQPPVSGPPSDPRWFSFAIGDAEFEPFD